MADEGNQDGTTDEAGAAGGTAGQEASAPSISVVGQYIKDLSFENPQAPASFEKRREKQTPPLSVTVNVGAKPSGDKNIEVELKIEARATTDEEVLFNLELVYAGLFQIRNVPQEQLHPFVLIECPRLLFPFARQIVAETISSGGFPPVMLDPIDFTALYRQRMARQKEQQEQVAGGNGPSSQPPQTN